MLKTRYNTQPRQATWLELFFDLVFVAVIGVVTHELAYTHNGHISAIQFLRFPLVFIPVWWIWATHTLYANRFDNNDRPHRVFALIIMALVVLLSTFEKNSYNEKFQQFAILYSVIRLMLAMLYLRIHVKYKSEVCFAREMMTAILIGAVISGSSVLFNGVSKFIVFYAGIAIDMGLQFMLCEKTKQFPVDRKHIVERIGLLALIILGESVISMISGLSEIIDWNNYTIAAAVSGFTIVWAIWWIYFDSFSRLERAIRITDGNVLIYTHLFLCMGLLILANLIEHSIKGNLDRETFRMLAITGMFFFYFGKQTIYLVCFPPFRTTLITCTSICLGITIASAYLPRIEYSLIGMTVAMLFYVYCVYNWMLPSANVDEYMVQGIEV